MGGVWGSLASGAFRGTCRLLGKRQNRDGLEELGIRSPVIFLNSSLKDKT